MKRSRAPLYLVLLLSVGVALPIFFKQPYFYYASYIVLEYIALSVAWNLLGGYGGYLNFGTSAFFGVGAYASAYIFNSLRLPVILAIPAGGAMADRIRPSRTVPETNKMTSHPIATADRATPRALVNSGS